MRHPLSDAGTELVRVEIEGSAFRATEKSRPFIRETTPVNALVVHAMALHPDDYEEARFALLNEVDLAVYRARFARVKLVKDMMVPRGHARLQSTEGHVGLVRFR